LSGDVLKHDASSEFVVVVEFSIFPSLNKKTNYQTSLKVLLSFNVSFNVDDELSDWPEEDSSQK
jgi:hypothetical protein